MNSNTVAAEGFLKRMPAPRGAAPNNAFGRLGRRFCFLVIAFVLLGFVPLLNAANPKNVLILSEGRGRLSINQMESSVRAHFSEPVNYSIVDLDNPRFEQNSYQENLAEAIRAGYANERLNLILTVGTVALRFAVQYRDKVFPRVPIVFMSSISPLPERVWPGVTGVQSGSGVHETIDLALRLHPDTQTVAIITKVTGADRDWYLEEHSELLRHPEVREIDLFGPPSPELLQKVAELPSHTVVLFQLYPQDANQPAFGSLDVLATVAQRFPTYSILPFITLGRGGVGGASYDPPTDAILAGQLAARVLSGEQPDSIPVEKNDNIKVSVDWQQLRHWNIPDSALPAGTLVVNREATLWDRGRKYFILGSAVILAQAFLIVGLFWQRSRKRKVEAELRSSEERFSKSFRESPLAISITRMSDSRYIDINETFEQQTGWSRNEVIGRTPLDLGLWVNSNQRGALTKQLLATGQARGLEASICTKDGQTRTILISAELIEIDHEPCSLSVVADITERKKAEEALSSLSRRLIEAQEEERTRIARELHDDINQRVGVLAINLSALKKDIPASETLARKLIERACEDISDLGHDVHALSHRLHSSKLDFLGLAAAAGSFCREFSESHGVEIEFHAVDIPRKLPSEISICLFRVLQEALKNAEKYSGTRRFEATLEGALGEIRLSVHDSGVGFDAESTVNRQGLGLVSMAERLKLVGGQLFIDSKQQCGTTIRAHVPLNGSMKTAAAHA